MRREGYDCVGGTSGARQHVDAGAASRGWRVLREGSVDPLGRVLTGTFDGANRTQTTGGSFLSVGTSYIANVTYAQQGGMASYSSNMSSGYQHDALECS